MDEFEQIKTHYINQGVEPQIIIKTKFRFKWGLPFPFVVLTSDVLDIIAIKQREPKLYRSISRKDLLYAQLSSGQLVIVLTEEKLLIPFDDQTRKEDIELLLVALK